MTGRPNRRVGQTFTTIDLRDGASDSERHGLK